ncbi:MAG: sugar transferase [Terracidiphilus sp.]
MHGSSGVIAWRFDPSLEITGRELMAPLGVFVVSLIVVSRYLHLYSPARIGGYLHEQRLTVQACLTAGLLVIGMMYLTHILEVPRSLLLIMLALVTSLLGLRRFVHRFVLEKRHLSGLANRHILVVGSLPEAAAVKQHLDTLRHLGFLAQGIISLPGTAEPVSEEEFSRIFEQARAQFVDEIFLVNPFQAGIAREMLRWARAYEIDLRIVPSLYEGLTWNRAMEYVGQFPTFSLHRAKIPEFSLFIKHTMDFVLAALFLAIGAVPMLVIAVLIKLDSKGPVFYRSERVGRKGRIFKCTKFRTMIPDADLKLAGLMHLNERNGAFFKLSNDPRITRVGRFLRKFSIDELPQLFDVLRGELSIVGPRPPIASEVMQYDVHHLRRLEVTPGITGLWQVQARQDPSFDSYISLDLAYIENWSVWLDLKIMIRTIGVVLAGTGS